MALLLISIGLGALSAAGGLPRTGQPPLATGTALIEVRSRADHAASRSLPRTAPPATAAPSPSAGTPKLRATASPRPTKTATRTPSPKPTATRTTVKPAATTAKALPKPVGGLSQTQMNHAATIVRVGQELAMPNRAYVIAIATALQESSLRNLANATYPETLDLTGEGVGADHDSVGLFQQRPASGWGTPTELMNPATTARKFYQALARVAGWQSMSLAQAAQAVQVSAFPDAYAKHEPLATQVIEALT